MSEERNIAKKVKTLRERDSPMAKARCTVFTDADVRQILAIAEYGTKAMPSSS